MITDTHTHTCWNKMDYTCDFQICAVFICIYASYMRHMERNCQRHWNIWLWYRKMCDQLKKTNQSCSGRPLRMMPRTMHCLHNLALKNRWPSASDSGTVAINGNLSFWHSSDSAKDIALRQPLWTNPRKKILVCCSAQNWKFKLCWRTWKEAWWVLEAHSLVRWDQDKFVQLRWGPACLAWTWPGLPQWIHRPGSEAWRWECDVYWAEWVQ